MIFLQKKLLIVNIAQQVTYMLSILQPLCFCWCLPILFSDVAKRMVNMCQTKILNVMVVDSASKIANFSPNLCCAKVQWDVTYSTSSVSINPASPAFTFPFDRTVLDEVTAKIFNRSTEPFTFQSISKGEISRHRSLLIFLLVRWVVLVTMTPRPCPLERYRLRDTNSRPGYLEVCASSLQSNRCQIRTLHEGASGRH